MPGVKWASRRLKNKCKRINWLHRKIISFNSYEFIFRFFIEGCLDFLLNVLITFRMMTPKYWKSGALIFSNVVCLFNATIAILIPILTMIITYRYNKKMKTDKPYRKKYKFIF